ncbi:MFS transporter [Coxiella burnetii]
MSGLKYLKESPLVIALVAGIGMFLSTLDSGIINIAIPTLLRQFNAQISTVIWTVTLYTLTLSATILLFGRLADRVGRLQIYRWGLILFSVSSLLCGTSTNIWLLILFRALQGLSAAMMQATAIAIITTRLDEHSVAKAMGIFGMIIGLGPMMGPVLSGFILSTIGWRWIFWLNIPICLVGIVGCKKLAPVKEVLHEKPIDYSNLGLLALSMFSLLLTMSFVGHGIDKFYIAAIITIALLSIYFWLEKRSKHPIIPMQLFKSLKFTASMLGIIAFGGATAVAFMLPPIYLEKLKHFDAWQVGLISLSAPLGIVFSSQISARLVQSVETLIPMLIGLTIMVFALLSLTQIAVDWPVAWLFLLLLFYGVGGGLYQTPCYINLTKQFPSNNQAFIAALTRMIQNLAIAFEAAGAAMFIGLKTQRNKNYLIHGISHGWWLAGIISMIAWITLFIFFVQNRKTNVIRK